MGTPSLQSVYDYIRYDCELTIPLRSCAGFGATRRVNTLPMPLPSLCCRTYAFSVIPVKTGIQSMQ